MMGLRKYYWMLLLAVPIAGYSQAVRPASSGIVRGEVKDKNNGRPLTGALVLVVNDTLRQRTGPDGRYEIKGVPTGYNTLYVDAEGYSGVLTESFLVTTSAPAVVNVELEKRMVTVGEVVVSASPFRPTTESPVSMRRIGTEEIDLTPGANRDISKVVQSAPGVLSVPTANRNDVLVRGGGANENRYYLDGIEIPVLNHFAVQGGSGGNASLVNPELLKSVNFYTGAFPAQFSNGLSSVMDMQMRSGNSDRFHGKLILGASDVGLNVDTPVSANGKTTLTGSFRRSYLQMLFKVLKLPFLPTYNDYQFKVNSKLSDRDELYIIGLGSFDKNRLNLSMKDPEEDRKYILGYLPENNQISYVFGAGYLHSFTGGRLQVTASRDYLKNQLYKYENNDEALPKTLDIDSREGNYRVRAAVSLWDLNGFRLQAGVGGGTGSYRNETFRQVYTADGSQEDRSSSRFTVGRYEFFATLSRDFFRERLSVLAGLRADGMTYSDLTSNPFRQLSPRVSLSYKLSRKWRLSASVARYHQEPSYTTMGYNGNLIPDYNQKEGLRYMAVNQYIAGVNFSPTPQSDFKLEGFYKQYSRLPVSLLDSLPVSTGDFADYIVGDVPAKSVGKGRAYGGEFSYRNLNLYNTVVNLAYTFFVSQVNKMDGELRPTSHYLSSSWNVGHIFNVSAIHKFGANWTVGAKWYLSGGVPYTPYDETLSSLTSAWDARRRPYPDNTRYNGMKMPVYHQLDLRVDKVWYFNKWRLGFYLDIQNLYNYKAAGQEILMPEIGADGQYVPDPNKPGHYKMQHIAHDIGGTILPTLGITIEM